MAELTFLPATRMAELVRRKQVSPVELVRLHLERAERLQPKLNAFVVLDHERAIARAREAEAAVMRGEQLGRLHGVPLTIKSSIDVAGLPCETGTGLRRNYIPKEDAPLVARLKAAGGIVIGNTNVPEFLMAYETDNLLYGRTSNPWDLARTPGGSSGGEAAAIAAGCSAAGVGSDGGGSIRVPAHFSGICGLKPTPGRIPSTSHFPPGAGAFNWLGVVGPMARTVLDLRVLLKVMAGPDPGDACSAPVPVRDCTLEEVQQISIGFFEDGLGQVGEETRAAVRATARALVKQGFTAEAFRPQGLERALELWWVFFGQAIGMLLRSATAGREAELSPMLREYLAVAAAEGPLDLERFLTACAERDLCRARILAQMDRFPILLSPASGALAFRHGEGTWNSPVGGVRYRETMGYAQWVNLTGNPAAVVPVGFSSEGLPIGVQVIGRPHEEEVVLAIAERIEQWSGGWRKPHLA